jgi:hypothetical protein
MSGDGRRVGEADANTVDTAVGAGKHFQAQALFHDHLSGQRDVAGDLGDQAAKRSRFIVFGKADGGGVVAGVSQ